MPVSAFPLPTDATDDLKRYAYVCRLQQSLLDQFNTAGVQYVGTDKWQAFVQDHRARMFKVCAEMNRLRAVLWPKQVDTAVAKPPPDPAFEAKMAGRADKKLDGALKDHPVLILPDSLKIVPFADPTQDFTSYTEVDIGANRITVNDVNTITVTTVDNDEDCYVYSDKGLNHFTGTFNHLISHNISAYGAGVVSSCHSWGLSTAVGNFYTTGNAVCVLLVVDASANQATYLRHLEAGVQQATDNTAAGIPSGTNPNYLTVSHAGTQLDCYIYSDAARTAPNLLDTLTIDDDGDARQYAYPMCSRNTSSAGRSISMVIEDLDLQEIGGAYYYREQVCRRRF